MMIEIKISEIDIRSLSNLSDRLVGQEVLTYEHLPMRDKQGRILACDDATYIDIAVQLLDILGEQSRDLAIGYLVNFLFEQMQKKNVGHFFSIGTQQIGKKTLTEDQIRKVVQDELEKALKREKK